MWKENNETLNQGNWADVFEFLEKDKDRFLNPITFGKKGSMPKKELVFFLGEMKAVLTEKGFRFEVK